MIKVKSTKTMGRGVFATRPISKRTLIETNYLLTYPEEERTGHRISLFSYDFEVSPKTCGIALGLISLVNHSETPNAEYEIDARKRIIKLKALKDIKRGEQLFIDYGYDPEEWK